MSAGAKVHAMNVAVRKPMTQDEFFTWADAQEGRYEFDGIQPVAMTGGTNNHGRISRNTIVQLTLRLRGGPCEAMPAEGGGVATSGNKVRYPDATVTCSGPDGRGRFVDQPVVVFEVVSPSTGRNDRILKLREYQDVPSILTYVIVESETRAITVLSRDDAGGPFRVAGLTDEETLELPAMGISIPVAELYVGVDFGDVPAS